MRHFPAHPKTGPLPPQAWQLAAFEHAPRSSQACHHAGMRCGQGLASPHSKRGRLSPWRLEDEHRRAGGGPGEAEIGPVKLDKESYLYELRGPHGEGGDLFWG